MDVHIDWTTKLCIKTKSMDRTHAREDTCLCIRQPHLAGSDGIGLKPAPPLHNGPRPAWYPKWAAACAGVCISKGRETGNLSTSWTKSNLLALDVSVIASGTGDVVNDQIRVTSRPVDVGF